MCFYTWQRYTLARRPEQGLLAYRHRCLAPPVPGPPPMSLLVASSAIFSAAPSVACRVLAVAPEVSWKLEPSCERGSIPAFSISGASDKRPWRL